MVATKRMLKKDIARMCRYIGGMLFFYGVMELGEVRRRVQALFQCPEDLWKFRAMLEKASLDDSTDDAMFDVVDDHLVYLAVDDAAWVLSEQAARPKIDFRPLSDSEIEIAGNQREELLFEMAELNLLRWLIKHSEPNAKMAAAKIIDLQEQIRNDCPFGELVKAVQGEQPLQSMAEAQEMVGLLQELYNNTHQWILKGWTSSQVFEKHEKPALRPLPPTPFPTPNAKMGEMGRNDPCPCGSGKKVKKCCMHQ